MSWTLAWLKLSFDAPWKTLVLNWGNAVTDNAHKPDLSRRRMFREGAVLATTAAAVGSTALAPNVARAAPASNAWAKTYSGRRTLGDSKVWEPGVAGKDYSPVVVPNGVTLPYRVVDGVKVFHLVAQEVEHEFAPGLQAYCWGYNGHVHASTIEVVEGDRVRVYVTNRLKAPTTVHWHGVFVPSGMDGVGGLNQRAIQPGETFMYEWTFKQFGTFMYHSHHDEMTQMALGLMGMIVVHPRKPPPDYAVDRDFVIMLGEWSIPVGTRRPNPNEMTDFNVLTMNAKAFPGTAPLVCKTGDRVRLRFGNLSAMDHHPIHLHGYHFNVAGTDGGRIPVESRWPETTVLVPTGSTREVEFIADEPGDWAMHCHMTHHVMNQMGHGIPNMIGVNPEHYDHGVRRLLPNYMTMGQTGMADMAEMGMQVPHNSIPMMGGKGPYDTITMGGMFTIVKVRDTIANYDTDPGWYQAPAGTQATLAKPEDLLRDGVKV